MSEDDNKPSSSIDVFSKTPEELTREDLRKILEKTSSSLEKLDLLINRFNFSANEGDKIFRLKSLKGDAVGIYRMLEEAETFLVSSVEQRTKSDVFSYCDDTLSKAFYDKDTNCFLFSCGMLPGKNNYFKKNFIDSVPFYCEDVRKKTEFLFKNSPEATSCIDDFKDKIIHFVFVYPKNQEHCALDSDNHNTLKMQNTITAFFPKGDKSTFCTTIFDTLICEGNEPLTLILLQPQSTVIKSKNEILSLYNTKMT